jgi:predicted transcriptional regulator
MTRHLAIMKPATIQAILSGHKTIESRFSQARIAPFGVISPGDLVYMKEPGGEIIGQFRVKKVYSYQGLTTEDIDQIIAIYGPLINSGEASEDKAYWKAKRTSRYGTLVFISGVERLITSPIRLQKHDQRGWMALP